MAQLEKAIIRYLAFYENLTDETVDDLRTMATSGVRYRDPTMDCQGIDAVCSSMHKWFRDLEGIKFINKGHAVDGLIVYSHWVMIFRIRKLPKRLWELEGMSKITFDANAKITDQVDYWDPSPMLESVPVLGKTVTLLKRFFS